MKWTLPVIVFLSFSLFVQAQNTYFQQDVNYKINVKLDDKTHTLNGKIDIIYTNHAPTRLDTIYIHLWPNAYSNQQTAFAKQQILNGSNEFYFAKEKDLGHITELAFAVNGQPVKWHFLNKNSPDIAYILLAKPLLPEQTITIHTPFKVKIPVIFSRLGHVKTAYQITQWYPKPAVYDRFGWHPMPYLDLGEFYSEFGDFDVSITLPENYVVGATGTLQTDSEKDFLAQKIEKSKSIIQDDTLANDFPTSSSTIKTIRYTAKNVHDFAWFADKRFLVTKDTVQLSSGKIIDTWAMFPPSGIREWSNATDYLNQAVRHYSKLVGEYPYPHATAVQSALNAGSGMEYPMITIIGETFSKKMTDNVISHEVGHNWFYGILASNERDHAWMDEGMNSYYELRYMDHFYPPKAGKEDNIGEQQLIYLLYSRLRKATTLKAPVETMSEINYGLTAYAKPALGLQMLEAFVGRPTFDRTMKKYYGNWKFKHPYPEDFKKIWTKNTDKNLDWFFEDIISTTKTMDYKLLAIKEKDKSFDIKVINKGALKGPLLLFSTQTNQEQDSLFVDGFVGTQTISFPKPTNGSQLESIEIDQHHRTLDLYPKNNKLHGAPIKLKLGIGMENNTKNYLFYLPIYGWNEYDKNMLGIAFYNEGILNQNLFYSLIPMYSFGAKTIVGTAEIQYPIYTNSIFRKITPRISARRFSYYYNSKANYFETYTRIMPSLNFELQSKKRRKKTIILTHEIIQTDQPVYKNGEFKNLDKVINQYDRLYYTFSTENAIQKHYFASGLEYAQYDNFGIGKKQYTKISGCSRSDFFYQPQKRVRLGFHAGYFLQNDARYSSSFNNGLVMGSLTTSGTGRDDYAFRSLHFGRDENSGLWGQQVKHGDAGIKHPVLNGSYGHSNDWMFGLNLSVDLPIKLPSGMALKPYFDAAFYGAPQTNSSTQTKKVYSGGIQLDLGNFLLINFPLFNNKELNDLLKQRKEGNYLGRITFSINLHNVTSPRKIQEIIIRKL